MYSILVEAVLGTIVEGDRARPIDPLLCSRLVDEPNAPRPQVELSFHIGPSCLEYDYLSIRNVSGGRLCSQRFIDILTSASVPFTAYPVHLLEWNTEHPITERYFFWIPKRVSRDEAIDWERSEDRIDPETGVHWLTKLVLRTDYEVIAPLLFVTAGRYLVNDSLRAQLEAAGISGLAFAPLDAAHDPYTGVKRETLELFLREHPEDWERWYKLSLLYNDQRALEPLSRVLELKPDLEEALYRRGRILYQIGSLQEALEAVKRVIELNPQSRAWGEYSTILRELEHKEESLTSAEHWVQIWGESPLPWYELGKAHAALGHYEEAVQAIDRGFALKGVVGPYIEEVLRIKGEMLYQLGRYKEALSAYALGTKMNARYRALYEGKAKTLHALGRNKEALRAEQELQKLEQEREENLKKRPK